MVACGAKQPFGEPTITLEAKAWLTSPSSRKAKELGYPHELWTTRMLARHAREHGPAEGHPCLVNTKIPVARLAAPDWSRAGSRGGAQILAIEQGVDSRANWDALYFHGMHCAGLWKKGEAGISDLGLTNRRGVVRRGGGHALGARNDLPFEDSYWLD
jgi:hypothetical protein